MTDAELRTAIEKAREAAYNAPFATYCTENRGGKPTGHHFLENHTTAWARHARVYRALQDELDRRRR